MGEAPQRRSVAPSKARAVLTTGPAQVAIDCAVLMLAATTLLLLLSDPPWAALIPGVLAFGLSEARDRLDDPTQVSSVSRLTIRVVALLCLVTLAGGLWFRAVTHEWTTALHALVPTFVLAVVALEHSPWSHLLKDRVD